MNYSFTVFEHDNDDKTTDLNVTSETAVDSVDHVEVDDEQTFVTCYKTLENGTVHQLVLSKELVQNMFALIK